ncbi:MAG: hypothetical protein ACFFD4_00120 [Candidatus Odinarchaeota archaeon]
MKKRLIDNTISRNKKGSSKEIHYPESYGTLVIVFLDLDNFAKVSEMHGWNRYSPNPCTGTLTDQVEEFTVRFHGTVVWGLNRREGTEEALVWLNNVNVDEIVMDVDAIRQRIESLGLGCTLSAGIVYSRASEEHFKPREFQRRSWKIFQHPLALLAKKTCNRSKRKGGNTIEIVMA